MTDPISDMLNRIMNAQAVFHESVSLPFSRIKNDIALILKKEGFVKEVEKKGRKEKRIIKIDLKYVSSEVEKKMGAIEGVKKISKPGQRIYVSVKEIKSVKKSGYGISVISTSKGLMTGQEARKNKLGGELICEIW